MAGEVGRFDFEVLDKDKLANTIEPDKPAVLKGENKLVPGRHGQAVDSPGTTRSISLWVISHGTNRFPYRCG